MWGKSEQANNWMALGHTSGLVRFGLPQFSTNGGYLKMAILTMFCMGKCAGKPPGFSVAMGTGV